MPPDNPDRLERIDRLQKAIASINQLLQLIQAHGPAAPPGCWVARYQVRHPSKIYWYYKLQSNDAIFSTASGRPSKYQHLGKAGTVAHVESVMQVTRRGLIDELQRVMATLTECVVDVGF
ncbi:MAG: transposase, partial [Microcystaceae cyanobacterium]